MNQTKSDPDVGPVLTALPGNTPEYLKEALGMKKPKHARSAGSGESQKGNSSFRMIRNGEQVAFQGSLTLRKPSCAFKDF